MFWIILGAVGILALVFLTAYICFYLAFFSSRRKKKDAPEFEIPPGDIYEPYREQMISWMKEAREMPHSEVTTTSFDGLKLYGKYYEFKKGAPIEIMMHGYRGTSERDLCGGVQRCFSLGRNCLLVDQRGCGKSEGHVITFGVKEHRDCISWVNYILENIDPNAKIILCGISMGAATVLTASCKELPPNVVGVLADCGYTSANEIIKKVIRQLKLPVVILYPFVKLGARIYGGFKLEEISPVEAVKSSKLPIIFFHGENDDFVPCDMSIKNYEACQSDKLLITIPNAGHGLCYLVDPKKYLDELYAFSVNNYKVECVYNDAQHPSKSEKSDE